MSTASIIVHLRPMGDGSLKWVRLEPAPKKGRWQIVQINEEVNRTAKNYWMGSWVHREKLIEGNQIIIHYGTSRARGPAIDRIEEIAETERLPLDVVAVAIAAGKIVRAKLELYAARPRVEELHISDHIFYYSSRVDVIWALNGAGFQQLAQSILHCQGNLPIERIDAEALGTELSRITHEYKYCPLSPEYHLGGKEEQP